VAGVGVAAPVPAGAAVGAVAALLADGVELVARNRVGVSVGVPVGRPVPPVVSVLPNIHSVTLPGWGRYVSTPTWLSVQVVWPGAACQYDQDAEAGGVLVHGVVVGSATPVAGSVTRQTNAVPYWTVPTVSNPAVCMACSPLVDPAEGSAPQPRSAWPPNWLKSTTTITPRVVEQSLTGSAAAGAARVTRRDVAAMATAPEAPAAITARAQAASRIPRRGRTSTGCSADRASEATTTGLTRTPVPARRP
jgi:hypothetical protein